MKPVCLVIGAGASIGGHTGKKFAAEGYFFMSMSTKRLQRIRDDC